MPFGLKNVSFEFQNIMNDIFNFHFQFIIMYINDVLVFSDSLEKHFVHLKKFFKVIKTIGMACSSPKMKLFQTKIRFLRHEIYQGKTRPIQRSIEFTNKFPYEIKDKKQLQRFLGCLNYVSDYFKDLRIIVNPYTKDLEKMHLLGLSIILVWSKKLNKESNVYHVSASLIQMHCSL